MTKKKIFHIDLWGYERIIVKEEIGGSYELVSMESPEGILTKIETEKPDLIILDMTLKDFDGRNVLKDIRNCFYGLPVILFTAYELSTADMKSIDADFFVIRSHDLSELKKKIAMALDSGQAL